MKLWSRELDKFVAANELIAGILNSCCVAAVGKGHGVKTEGLLVNAVIYRNDITLKIRKITRR